ncbi:uncharacterized protein CPUR_06831 [Claviceps purpurea 20.1]|uniref:Tc1-like transposase DDE domain-containing protein n=1 Tax=Claviceps purpurea (strain 20.1) TaxID=1111077 RepID=M1W7K7_CLAP2|nr:uncharacterized protein CPUR_06831 [Claviceps purpurea 20.1]
MSLRFGGGIRSGNQGPLVVLPGDPDSKRGGVTSAVCCDHLEKYFPTMLDGDTIFMHDNAPIHTAKMVKECLEELEVTPLEWPPYSPNLDPIENLWSCLKQQIFKRDRTWRI